MDERVFVHRIDRADRMIYVDDEWLSFAVENGSPELTKAAVMGRPLWDFIEDQETRHIFKEIFMVVRGGLVPFNVPFRCDSPDRIRVMEMEIIPLLDGVIQFNCRLLREERREPVMLLEKGKERSEELLTICSWCKRIKLEDDVWVELEGAARELDLFGEPRPPSLTGGICPECNSRVFGKGD